MRNHLYPQKLAVYATLENLENMASNQSKLAESAHASDSAVADSSKPAIEQFAEQELQPSDEDAALRFIPEPT